MLAFSPSRHERFPFDLVSRRSDRVLVGDRGVFFPPACGDTGFSMVELLVVIAIILVMMGLAVPAFSSMKGGADITKAAYDVSGAIQTARAYAMANNTYTWLGFFEEDPTKSAGTAGTGRLVMSIVSSRDGTTIYGSQATAIDPARLSQVGKLVKVDNIHLKAATSTSDPVFPIGTGTGDTFDTRPAVGDATAQIGDMSPGGALMSFQYPVASPAAAQYTFAKVIQFSPRGEANNNSYNMKPVIEVGLQPTHGTAVDANNRNVAAIQVSGIAGNVRIFRR